MIEIITYYDYLSFREDVIPFLKQNEIQHSLPLGVISSLNHEDETPIVMATAVRGQKIRAVFFQNHPLQLILAKEGTFISEEISHIATQLHSAFPHIPGLIGDREFTIPLAEKLAELRSLKVTVHMNQRLYKLEKPKKKARKTGTLHQVNESDKEKVTEWIYKFSIEINQPLTLKEAEKKAEEMTGKGSLFAWEVDGELVSMANAGRPTEHNVTINFVYTPTGQRRKGYASDCVAALSQAMFEQGYTSTSLYTDLDNSTSNKIYMGIGYQPVMDSIVLFFD